MVEPEFPWLSPKYKRYEDMLKHILGKGFGGAILSSNTERRFLELQRVRKLLVSQAARRLLRNVNDLLILLPDNLNEYYFARRTYSKKYKGKTYTYTYWEVYSQARRGADMARLVKRVKSKSELRPYELETRLAQLRGLLLKLRFLLGKLLEEGVAEE